MAKKQQIVYTDVEVNESDFSFSTLMRISRNLGDATPVQKVVARTMLSALLDGFKDSTKTQHSGMKDAFANLKASVSAVTLGDIKAQLIREGKITATEEPRIKIIGLPGDPSRNIKPHEDILLTIKDSDTVKCVISSENQEQIASLSSLNAKYKRVKEEILWSDIKKDFLAGTATPEVAPFCRTENVHDLTIKDERVPKEQ